MKTIENLIDKYVKNYYASPDCLSENNGKTLLEWKASMDFYTELKELLSDRGWRNRVVAATVIGVLKENRFLDQIFIQAQEFDEYHAAKSYAFCMLLIGNEKATKYLKILVDKEIESDYSKKLQRYYLAALLLLDPSVETNEELENEKQKLLSRKEKWKNFVQQ